MIVVTSDSDKDNDDVDDSDSSNNDSDIYNYICYGYIFTLFVNSTVMIYQYLNTRYQVHQSNPCMNFLAI